MLSSKKQLGGTISDAITFAINISLFLQNKLGLDLNAIGKKVKIYDSKDHTNEGPDNSFLRLARSSSTDDVSSMANCKHSTLFKNYKYKCSHRRICKQQKVPNIFLNLKTDLSLQVISG